MTLTPLLLVGAGGFARETLELVRAVNRRTPTWRALGLLDDDPRMHGSLVHDTPVIGPSAAVHDYPDALVSVCVASPENPFGRLRLVRRLGLPPERYATLVHPAAVVPETGSLGPGSIVHATTVITADVTLGAHAAVMPAVVLTHDDRAGDGVTLGAGARLAGGVTLADGVYIGSGALLREHVVVGAGAVIGMGAVVTEPVPAGEVWAGVPARRVRPATLKAAVR